MYNETSVMLTRLYIIEMYKTSKKEQTTFGGVCSFFGRSVEVLPWGRIPALAAEKQAFRRLRRECEYRLRYLAGRGEQIHNK